VRAPIGAMMIALLAGLVSACDGSPTAPGRCIDHTTSNSYQDLQSVSGTIAAISEVQGSPETTQYQIVKIAVQASALVDDYTVNANTAVFEQIGSQAPTAASICLLAVGQQVQVSTGFGDFDVAFSPESASVPLPLLLGQIVIQR
jgi:hypothetical protein